jgi:hypothetical protein
MDDWRGEIDVSKTFTTNFRLDNFNAAFLADNAAMLHSFIFTAVALIVLDRTKDFCTEQTIAFWLECTIIDRLWFFDFTMAPLMDFLRASQADAHRLKTGGILWTVK